MRGIILAGGTGSRLGPLTKAVNKHLLPVYDRPMIMWPIKVLCDNGIDDITIVSSPLGIGQLAMLLGSGAEHECKYTYKVQDTSGGIAAALRCVFDEPEPLVVILGDNIFLPPIKFNVEINIATCFLTKIDDLETIKQFGVASFDGNWLYKIVEKPTDPPSNLAVTGLYIFPPCVQLKTWQLGIGKRGEYEITDLLNIYASQQLLAYKVVEGFWGDAGTIEGMTECSRACKEWSNR